MKTRRILLPALILVVTVPLLFSVFASRHKHFREKEFGIINAHEHFQSTAEVPKFLKAMRENGVERTVIVGSPEATILSGRVGFSGEEKYNLEVLKIANTHPDHFMVFPTIDVRDPEKLEKLKRYIQMGGRGLKLYSGHTMFHEIPLDDPGMLPVYEYCETHHIPVLFHVNTGYYQQEFENVLRQFPKLRINCPHFCMASIATNRFEHLMDTYPNLYTDISFGFMDYLRAGLSRISRDPEKYQRIIGKYQDRIFFGTDMVVTNAKYKTMEWLSGTTRAYRDMLEKEQYTFFGIENKTLRGLHLDPVILQKIYQDNFKRFMDEN